MSYFLPRMSQKQLDIFNNYQRYLLVSGPKGSGKTIGVEHKTVRHAVDYDRANIGVFVKTMKVAKDGGCWHDLTEIILPEWFEADVGITYKKRPTVDGTTRQPYFEISNRHGTSSRFSLNSLDYDDDILAAIRGKRYSMIWFNELDNFKLRKVFDISSDQLRSYTVPDECRQWIADTNPSDEGEDSWIYKLWWEERLDDDHEFAEELRDRLGLIEVMIPDNPFLTEQQKNMIYARFKHDPDLYARYCLGLWVTSTTDSHFSDVFRPELHVVGSTDDPEPDNWEILLPEDGCTELVTGWDIGDINHSVQILEPAIIDGQSVFKVLDEVVIIKQNIGINELTEIVMERMAFWEGQIGHPVLWRHWSDKSAFDRYRAAADVYDQRVVYEASDGAIMLQPSAKRRDIVRARISLARRLLFEGRLLISARCHKTIQMFKSLKKGKSQTDFVDRGSIHKHPFDSLTYALSSELPFELETMMPTLGRASQSSRVILAGLA